MSLAEKWEAYKKAHRIDLLRPEVRQELQSAFYAGAHAVTTRASDAGLLIEIDDFRSKQE